MNNLSW